MLFLQLDRYERRVLSREHPLSVSYKRSVARTLFIVVIVFVVLRLPFTILVVIRAKYFTASDVSVDSGMQFFSYFSQYLMFVNAAVNPLIYGFNNESFRRAYAQISCIQRRRRSAEAHPRVHHCWYCEFIKRRRDANANQEQNEQEIKDTTLTTAKETKRLEETSELSADNLDNRSDPQLSQIDVEGFI